MLVRIGGKFPKMMRLSGDEEYIREQYGRQGNSGLFLLPFKMEKGSELDLSV